jgi:N6-adenosine-specific RNA methylase IME4
MEYLWMVLEEDLHDGINLIITTYAKVVNNWGYNIVSWTTWKRTWDVRAVTMLQ